MAFCIHFYINIIPKLNKKSSCIGVLDMATLKNDLKELNLKYTDDKKNLIENLQKDEVLESSKSTKTKNVEFSQFVNGVDGVMSDKVKERISSCGDFLQFLADEKIEHLRLENANFCNNRFCPQCSQNKSREDAVQLATMINYLKQEFNYEFIFLTLTAPNIPAYKVQEELKEYSKSFERLFKTKTVKTAIKGYVRKLEMTYNSERDDFHPHYHILLAVNKSYFVDSRLYISQKEWLRLWANAKKDPTIKSVDIRKFKAKDDLYKAIFEISKYISKDSDYMYSPEVFKVFYKSLKGKRMLSYSGVFKDAVKLYKAGDLVDYMGPDPSEHIKYVKRLWYAWDSNDYKEVQAKDLSDEEIEKVNLTRKEKIALKKQQEQEIAEQNLKESKEREKQIAKIEQKIAKIKRERREKLKSEAQKIFKEYYLTEDTLHIMLESDLNDIDVLNNSQSLKTNAGNDLNKVVKMMRGVKELRKLVTKYK